MTQDSENTNNSNSNKPTSESAAEEEWNQAGDTQPRPATKDIQERNKRNIELSNDGRPIAKTMVDQELPPPEPAGRRHDRPDVPKTMLDHSFMGAHFKESFKKEEQAAKPIKAPINVPSSQPSVPMPEQVDFQAPSQPSRPAAERKPSSIMNPLTISGILLLIACMVAILFLPKSQTASDGKPAAAAQSSGVIDSGSKPSTQSTLSGGTSTAPPAATSATSPAASTATPTTGTASPAATPQKN